MPVAKKLSNYSKLGSHCDIIRGFECGVNKQDKEIHDKIVNLADNIIELNKKLAVEKNPNTITMVSRQISAVDKAIDKIVYMGLLMMRLKLYKVNNILL